MNSFVCSQIKTIGLFVTLFAHAASQDTVYFSTKPKDKEIFVGKDVQFDWEYVVEDVQEVGFGVVVEKNNVAILVKTEKGTIQNNLDQSVEWIRNRVEIVPDKRASFKIRNVELEDSTTFFCQVRYGIGKTESDTVKLSVVDLLINESASDTSEESWLNHKITVVCAVKIPEGHKATFSWMHIPSNRTVPKRLHDDTGSKSYLSMITKRDVEFETLQCRAENRVTVKYHKIDIKKLSPPSSPRNLKTQRGFDQESAKIYVHLKWDPPSTDGGTEIKHYVVQYVAEGLPWKSPNTAKTTSTEYCGLRLPNGKYNARVRAQNKAGLGPTSNEVLIDLEDFEPSQLTISGSSNMHCPEISLLLLSVLAWFL
ncbi:neural cell adhesion molecule 2-like isoform X2 [Stylophora pistillata]|uniref:neural cell adhesion molecule 2-like isoform X2 n=1 Tax=Stylophora pistillata TaxID=50429 RepID=UPI000C057C65|nr:neural cell adhesion molecule 2-like isoform X2 [Stylophora pistillata]